jgi:hypothetical protein
MSVRYLRSINNCAALRRAATWCRIAERMATFGQGGVDHGGPLIADLRWSAANAR